MSDTVPPNPERPPEQGVSLSELTEAFAEAMGGSAGPESAPQDPSSGTVSRPSQPQAETHSTDSASGDAAQTPPPDSPISTDPADAQIESPVDLDPRGDEDDSCPLSPRTILEAMLFVGNVEGEPLSAQRAAGLMRGVESHEIPDLVKELNGRYRDNGHPYTIVSEGIGYRMALRRQFHAVRNRFYGRVREARLSQAAKEVLAIVAYRQPLTSEQMTALRGTPSGHLLTQLVRRRLLRVERQQGKGRTVLYRTTDRFLKLFGLENLEDLPRSEELDTGVG